MTTKQARQSAERGWEALHKLGVNVTSDLEIVDLISDILICAELDYSWRASELVESALGHVRGELDGDSFTEPE
jgi:hypothetical protein